LQRQTRRIRGVMERTRVIQLPGPNPGVASSARRCRVIQKKIPITTPQAYNAAKKGTLGIRPMPNRSP